MTALAEMKSTAEFPTDKKITASIRTVEDVSGLERGPQAELR